MNKRALILLAASAGCAIDTEADASRHSDALRPVERKIVGAAAEYPADATLRSEVSALDASMKARREAAWQAVARALTPVTLSETGLVVQAEDTKLPLFRTWYGKDDFDRMFDHAYGGLSKDERQKRTPLSDSDIDAAMAWNAGDQGSWSDDEYLARVQAVTTPEALSGLGGNARVSYSPGLLRHLMGDYAHVNDCLPTLDTIDPGAEPPADNFAPCFSAEFPRDAAVVKASWYRADFGMTLPSYDTSAATLRDKRAGLTDEGGWGKGQARVSPEAGAIYTMRTSDGSRYRMPGLHIMTKELREWLWITLWWSPDPDSDFGADRPDEIRALGGPWSNYKMCVVTGYEEHDPDPRGGFDGSLGDALAAVHEGAGGPTWCSNPYVEKGARNAQTNCIGCHQHAGDPSLSSERVLALENAPHFPSSGRTKVRANFPADYVWSFDFAPEMLARLIERRVQFYDAADRSP